VRRIEAVTGLGVLELMNTYYAQLSNTADVMKANGADDVLRRATQLVGEWKEAQREVQTMRSQMAAQKAGDLFGDATDVGGVKVVTAVMPETDGNALRELCDRCKDRAPEKAVVVLAGTSQEKGSVTFVCWCTKEAIAAGANAGNIVREVAMMCGGKGGGKPDMAMAGGKDLSAVHGAMNSVTEILGKLLKQEVSIMDCIFCKIVAGEIPSTKVYEDELVLAFRDIQPQAPIHILVIPKTHISGCGAITAENSAVVAHIFETIPKIAAAEGITDFRVVSNCGPQAGQSVPHLHFHVLSGRDMTWPPG
jgi:histidine triad (HIT) family protein